MAVLLLEIGSNIWQCAKIVQLRDHTFEVLVFLIAVIVVLTAVWQNGKSILRSHREIESVSVGEHRPFHSSVLEATNVLQEVINVVVILDETVAGVLGQDMLENFAIRVDYIEQSVGIDSLCSCENNRLNLTLRIDQVPEKLIHVVSLIDQDRLAYFLEHELMLWVLESRFGHVSCILIADKRVQQDIVKLQKQGQSTMLQIALTAFLWHVNRLHGWQEHFGVDNTQVLKQASALLLHFLTLPVLFLVIKLLLRIILSAFSRNALLITLIVGLFALFCRFHQYLAQFLLLVERHVGALL